MHNLSDLELLLKCRCLNLDSRRNIIGDLRVELIRIKWNENNIKVIYFLFNQVEFCYRATTSNADLQLLTDSLKCQVTLEIFWEGSVIPPVPLKLANTDMAPPCLIKNENSLECGKGPTTTDRCTSEITQTTSDKHENL